MPIAVAAEADHMIRTRLGRAAQARFLEDLAAGRFILAGLDADDLAELVALDARYHDLDLGLADLSVVVVANRIGTARLLTFDERAFRVVTPRDAPNFLLLPSDG